MNYEKHESVKLGNGNTIKYKVYNGIYYHEETPNEVVRILENARMSDKRIRIFLGNSESGECWLEEYNVIGYIGRSGGSVKIPLLISKSNSMGGIGILDHCIIKITIDKRTVYQHEKFYLPSFTICEASENLLKDGYTHSVFADDKNVANFKSKEKAIRYIKFINGESNKK